MKKGWERNGYRSIFSTKGAAPSQPGASPQEPYPRINRGPKVRSNGRTVRPGLQPSIFLHARDLGRCPRLAWDGALPRKKGGQR